VSRQADLDIIRPGVELVCGLKIIELKGDSKSPAAKPGMRLDITLENDNFSQWIAGMMDFLSLNSTGGTGNDATGRIR